MRAEPRQDLGSAPTPEGSTPLYRTIVADPPWPMLTCDVRKCRETAVIRRFRNLEPTIFLCRRHFTDDHLILKRGITP